MRTRHSFSVLFLLVLSLLLAGSIRTQAQGLESEPNDSCFSPQDLGALLPPFSLTGSLDTPDIDYYRTYFEVGSASSTAVIDLERETLGDPLLAAFSSDCVLLALDDDGGGFLNSRIRINVPADGVLIIAATSYPDFGLTGQGFHSGTYRLSVRQEGAPASILGRVVDSRTGDPVPFAFVTLFRCFQGFCFEFVSQRFTDPDGGFRFDGAEVFLPEGDYRLVIEANNYQPREEMFHFFAGQPLDLGNVLLDPIPSVSSIGGRLVDAVTGEPLPGNAEPFAFVELDFCSPGAFCFPVRFASPDPQGRFLFADGGGFFPLFPGIYQIRAFANQYLSFTSELFTVEDGEDHDTGDLALKSFPVRIHLAQPCGPIPSQGGNCQFSVKITNGLGGRLAGDAWSVVQASGLATPTGSTIFQTGLPKALSLAPGESATLPFTFFVPREVSDGTFLCVRGLAASRPHSFNTLGDHHLFCLSKGGGFFRAVPAHEKRDAVRRSQGEGPPRK